LPASHGAVLVGILPLVTAAFAALRGKERPSPGFWLMAMIGSGLVIAFALRQSGGSFHPTDLMVLGAVVLGGLGYAEGGRLSSSMPGEQVICWALVLSSPLLLPLVLWTSRDQLPVMAAAPLSAWLGFGYISAFSMFIGFVFWYRGMALGGVARVGQVQLLQPFLTLVGAALILGEALAPDHIAFAAGVIAVVAAGRRMRVAR
ncbi:MAG: DMT family transporter, partial [Gammaproteobacteria bacterium]